MRISSAVSRLASYRVKAAAMVSKNPTWTAAQDWHYWARNPLTRNNSMVMREGKIYADCIEDLPGNEVINDKDLKARDSVGWYVDSHQDGIMYGAVVKMRTSKGVYYLPVTYCTEWDGVTAYLKDAEIVQRGADEDEHEKAIKEALYSARHYAEREAEQAREGEAEDQAEQQIEQCKADIKAARAQFAILHEELKTANLSPMLCQITREKLCGLHAEVCRSNTRIKALRANFWLSVE